MTDQTQKVSPGAVLIAVVVSSLALLPFGMRAPPGPFEIMELPVTFAQLAFIFICYRQLGPTFIQQRLSALEKALLSLLFIYVFIISFASSVPSSPLFAPVWLTHIAFFACLIAFLRSDDSFRQEIVWTGLGIAATVHVAVFLFVWAIWPDLIRQGFQPSFDSIRYLGYFLAPAAAVTAFVFITRHDPGLQTLLFFASAAFYLIYTGSRGGAVALVAAMIVIAAYMMWHKDRILLGRLGILASVTVLLVVVSEIIPSLPWTPLFGRGADLVGQTGSQALSGRDEVWQLTLDAISQNWVFGYGPAILGQVGEYEGLPFRQPHSVILQLLLHWGVVGTAITLAVVCAFLPNFFRAMRHRSQESLLALAALSTLCIHALVDGGLYYSASTVIAIIAFAILDRIGWKIKNDSLAVTHPQ